MWIFTGVFVKCIPIFHVAFCPCFSYLCHVTKFERSISGCFLIQKMLNSLKVGPAHSASISPDGEMIAVGLKNGGFVILTASSFKPWGQRRDRGQCINDVRCVIHPHPTSVACLWSYALLLCRFSPSGQYLAVGSEDGVVDFYDLAKGPQLMREGYCKGIQGFVTQMDFSVDSKFIKVGPF